MRPPAMYTFKERNGLTSNVRTETGSSNRSETATFCDKPCGSARPRNTLRVLTFPVVDR